MTERLDAPQDKAQKELCLHKKAVKALLRQNPEGLTHSQICRQLQHTHFPRTYRNLLFLTSAVLELLLGEGKIICKGEGSGRVYFSVAL